MIVRTILQDLVFIGLLVGVGLPLGLYIKKVMCGEHKFLKKVIAPVENGIYKAMGVTPDQEMSPKRYIASVMLFSVMGFAGVFLLMMFQTLITLNPQGLDGTSWHLAFNTAASFVTNTNWQSYSGETTLSYASQMLGLTVQNFVSAATGFAVLFALIRGITRRKSPTIGNFWVDLVRTTLYILLPAAFIFAIILISQGVVQNFLPYGSFAGLDGGAAGSLPFGPAASQIAIKMLGTNGGGFFGVNSAFPYENPTGLSNFLEVFSIFMFPAALCFAFGRAVMDKRQGRSIFIAMLSLFVISLTVITVAEYVFAPYFSGVAGNGNMEGKEVRFGIGGSTLWAAVTTAASNGSVNCMHDSLTPLAGMLCMFQMQLGEVVFGGVGCGLYGMLAFVILTVFIAGLMVGRTPEYLGKKIEPYDMKMACVVILTPPLMILIGTAITCLLPFSWLSENLTNTGAHSFSEILYAFSSAGGNNGSAFAGLNANNAYFNVALGVVMLVVRFLPIAAILLLAGNLAKKKYIPSGNGTLSTSNAMFTVMLIVIVILVGALSFLPALALGPIGEFVS